MNKWKEFKGSILFFLIIGSSILVSCLDTGDIETEEEKLAKVKAQFDFDLEQIDSYLETNLIVADTDSVSQIRYIMVEEGTGESPTTSDNVEVTYTGMFLNGEVFDKIPSADGKTLTIEFPLGNVIGAWQIMIPKLKEGGTIEFYAPSYYCYGPYGSGASIPPDAPLIFRVKLIAVNPI
ncbi:MAG: FKBP-type peptidyl-prolyl cis-trans isomerase [Bacteroidota bacterium]